MVVYSYLSVESQAFIEKSAWHVNRGHIEKLTIGIDD